MEAAAVSGDGSRVSLQTQSLQHIPRSSSAHQRCQQHHGPHWSWGEGVRGEYVKG